MASNINIAFLIILPLLLTTSSSSSSPQSIDYKSFINCLRLQTPPSTNISSLISTPTTPSFPSLLNSSVRNLRFVGPSTPLPSLILTPRRASHVAASVLCCRNHSLHLRPRSGGHDYEGLSYRSASSPHRPFALLDLARLRSVSIDPDRTSAWVGSGATLGELNYRIANTSTALGFPAGICQTVGVGGHLSGGGFGTLLRKYGLAADNVLDAVLVDVDGRILDRNSMGEDLFWAIRGAGGGSFGIVVSWKVKLVPVPSTVSVFKIHRTLGQGAIHAVDRWQYVAHRFPDELFVRIVLQRNRQRSEVEAEFSSLFLGNCYDLVKLMKERFWEVGLERDECREMSWIDSVMYFAGYSDGEPLEVLLDRGSKPSRFFKAKSDYATEPVPRIVWEKIWPRFLEEGAGVLIMDPHGGMMSRVSESETPYPHREGSLYNLQYFVEWTDEGEDASRKHMEWISRLYDEMGPFVSKNPRASYINYRDLDLGVNDDGREDSSAAEYCRAQAWGVKYFKSNFERLARVKGRVDPGDFFRNEQSIPPLVVEGGVTEECEVESQGSHQGWLEFFLSNMF